MSCGTVSGGEDGADVARVRCFVATFVEAESARKLEAAVRGCIDPRLSDSRAGRRVPVQNYHITLKFLGEVEQPAMAEAMDAVDSLRGHPVSARALSLIGLPRARSARLAAVELDAHEQLQTWWALLQARLGTERRRFRPHVTVLRLSRPRDVRPRPLAEPLGIDLLPPRLYRSDQNGDRVRYRPVERQ